VAVAKSFRGLVHGRILTRSTQSEQFPHLLIEEAFAATVGLNPFAVEDELRDGALAGLPDDFFGGAGG
jgi:hypothetical protein